MPWNYKLSDFLLFLFSHVFVRLCWYDPLTVMKFLKIKRWVLKTLSMSSSNQAYSKERDPNENQFTISLTKNWKNTSKPILLYLLKKSCGISKHTDGQKPNKWKVLSYTRYLCSWTDESLSITIDNSIT